jgi:DNA-binding MarR family transcriptional regulator/GNAT superfamily N-acetyltransferase
LTFAPSALAPSSDLEQRIAAVRRFSRFYTRQIGLLRAGVVDSAFSLAEGRILYELAHADQTTATQLAEELGLDRGYLSRILRSLCERDLVFKTPSPDDKRQILLSLTTKGRLAFADLDQRSQNEVAAMLEKIPPAEQDRIAGAMATIERLLRRDSCEHASPAYVLRPPRPGDMGWVVSSHGALYSQEYGWDQSFEALVAEIVAQFIRTYDASRERCWIADLDGEPVGSIFLVRASDEVAKLRLLMVERRARGLGIGGRLVEECVRFARQCGYAKITLWTQSVLVAAHRIYKRAGFKRVASEPHVSFGKSLVGETWELALAAGEHGREASRR